MRSILATSLVILSSLGIFLAVSLFSNKNHLAEARPKAIRSLHSPAPTISERKQQRFIFENWRSEQGIAVLCYHQILTAAQYRTKPTPYAVTIDKFAAQMRLLNEQGFQTITLDQLHAYITGQAKKPVEKPIVITFDDGLKHFTTMAEPVLNRYNFKAVLFIYPTYIQAKKPKALTWPQVRQASAKGHEIHSHTLWHPFLNGMSEKEEDYQFRISQKLLHKYAKVSVNYLAYPFGIHSARSPALLQKNGYKGAFTIFDGANLPGQDPYFINRYMIVYGNSLKTFQNKLMSRALPVAEVSPSPGSEIHRATRLSLVLPQGLKGQAIKVKFGSQTLPFRYDPTNGKLTSQLAPFKSRVRSVLIHYRENGQLYKATILYSRPRKTRS